MPLRRRDRRGPRAQGGRAARSTTRSTGRSPSCTSACSTTAASSWRRSRCRVALRRGRTSIEVTGAIAIANTIAYISELLDPISLFLGLTRQNLMTQALRYLLWGEGEIGLMVYKILLRYWEWTPGDETCARSSS